jgi:hypothetical protein
LSRERRHQACAEDRTRQEERYSTCCSMHTNLSSTCSVVATAK